MAAQSLQGKTALVTGASSGIGRATALALAAEGVRLALAGRARDRLEEVAAQAGGALVIPGDLTDPREVERTVAEARTGLGRIDILFANAGLYIPGDVADGDPDAWDRLISVNVNAVFRLVRAVLPDMLAAKSGDVIVTSSVSGHQAIQWEPVYSASKHAVQSFVHGLRRQVAPHNVRVGAVAPGMVLNELWGITDRADVEARVAAREGLRSEDVADAVIFMLTRPANATVRDLVILPQNQDI
jgi:ribitol 2-dehydrogenase